MAAVYRTFIGGAAVVLKDRTLRIDMAANQRSSFSGTVYVPSAGTIPTVQQMFGVVKDIAPGSRSFNGTTQYLTRAFTSGTIDNWTIGVWAYVTTTTGVAQSLFHVGDASDGYGVYVSSAGYWQGVLAGVAGVGGTASAVVTNAWTSVVLRRSGGASQLFVDGVAVGSSVASTPVAPNGFITVGARRNAAGSAYETFANGRLAHAFLAHTALTDAQILALHNGGPGGIGVAPSRLLSGTYWYYPVMGLASPEPDSAASTSLTVTGATASTDGPLVATHDAAILFAGEITKAPRMGLAGHPKIAQMDVRLSAADYMEILDRKVVTLTRPSESLSARWAAIIAAELVDDGVTLSSSQDAGPTMTARTYDHAPMAQVVEDLSVECVATESLRRVVQIDALKRLSMLTPGARPAAFDIEDGDGNTAGDVQVDEVMRDYADLLYMQIGAQNATVTEVLQGDGVTTTWDLTYVSVGNIGYVSFSGSGNDETLDRDGAAQWTINASNQLVRNWGAVPTGGQTATLVHTAQFPMWLEAGTGTRKKVMDPRPDIFDAPAGQALLDAALIERMATQSVFSYQTVRDGLEPGMSQVFGIAVRDAIGTATISEVGIEHLGKELMRYSVTAVTSGVLRTWQQTARRLGGVAR